MTYLRLGQRYTQDIDLSNLINIRKLILDGHYFSKDIDLSKLVNLTHLKLGFGFNKEILNVPESLEEINLPINYDLTRITDPHLRRLLDL